MADDFEDLAPPKCPVDLHQMEAVGPGEHPLWECPECGLRRAWDEVHREWWTTLNLPHRERMPLMLVEKAGAVFVHYDRVTPHSGPGANWREAERDARSWLRANP